MLAPHRMIAQGVLLLTPIIGSCRADSVGGSGELEPIATITVTTPTSPIPAGEPTPLTVVARDASGNPLSGRSFTFTSSNEQIARVSTEGLVTGGIPGTALIAAAAEGKTGAAEVTVIPGAPATIAIDPMDAGIYPNTSLQLIATIKDKVGNAVQATAVQWTSSNPAAIAVDSSGVIRGLGQAGTATITARAATISATASARIILVKQISQGASHGCFLDADGIAYCWGRSDASETGTGAGTPSPLLRPRPVAGSLRFQSISAGGSHSCALTSAGAAYCWGSNSRGSVGDGTRIDRSEPVPVQTSAAFSRLAAGWDHTCAQTAGGSVYCWGGDNYSATPAFSFESPAFDALYAGANLTCGLIAGKASCWGSNNHGQLGTGDPIGSLTPRPVAGNLSFVQIEGYQEVTCGLGADRTIYCWGPSFFGGCNDCGTTPRVLSANVPFTRFTVGRGQFCGIDSANAAYCFGNNDFGKLGIGTTTDTDIPTSVRPSENGETTFSAIAAGGFHTCAIGLSGTPHCWGRGSSIGIGILQDRHVPATMKPPEI